MKTIANENGEAVGGQVHVFERAGLGKAPFRFVAMEEKWYVACPGAPKQPGGSCDYCGESIAYLFHIRSSDGKQFHVGCDCVAKTGDAGLRKVVDAQVREAKRLANIRRQDAKIARAKELLPLVEAKLRAIPHPQDWRAKAGESKFTQVAWYLANAGRSGKCWAAREIEKVFKQQ